MSNTFVSVIIPVYNNSAELHRCLEALAGQSFPSDQYEVIVIDNNSQEDIRAVTDLFPGVRCELESRSSSYAARNRGIEASSGKLLAFTDSDCTPHQNWVEQGAIKLLTHGGCKIVGGRIDILYEEPGQPTMLEYFDSSRNFRQSKTIEQEHYAATANLFTYRDVLSEVGGFQEKIKSGGDKEWCQRASAMGYRLCYAHEAIVNHPARSTLRQIVNKQRRLSGGIYQEDKMQGNLIMGMTKTVIVSCLPPIQQAARMLKDEQSNGMRIKLFFFQWGMKLLHMFEYFRLILGGNPQR